MQEKVKILTRKIPFSWKRPAPLGRGSPNGGGRQKTRLLVLAGRRKTGKDVLLSYVMRNYPGFKHYRIAQGPDLIAKVLGLPVERRIEHALFGVNALLYPILGESAYKRRVAKLLDHERPLLAIVEAIRTKEEYDEFVVKRKGVLIGIKADNRLRHIRALRDAGKAVRKKDEDKMSFREFMVKELFPLERKIDWIVNRAHFVLDNSHNKKAPFYKAIDEVMRRLGFKKKIRR